MSWQAMGAVQQASRLVERGAFVGFRVLLAIAWYADKRGVAGRPGEREACPTQGAIAQRARVHVNTVANWLPRLEAAGELAVERHGAGRGVHTVYRILLPMAGGGDGGRATKVEETRDETAGETPRCAPTAEKSPLVDEQAPLVQRVSRLERKLEAVLSLLEERETGSAEAQGRGAERRGAERRGAGRRRAKARGGERVQKKPQAGAKSPQVRPQKGAERAHDLDLRSQEGGNRATSGQRGGVVDPFDPNFDPRSDPNGDPGGPIRYGKEAKGHKAPPPSSHRGAGSRGADARGVDAHGGPRKKSATARVKALAEVCGLDLRIAAHRRQCEQAAGQLGHYSAETIRERFGPLPENGTRPPRWQWYVDDWRGRRKGEQPRPRDVVANISRERVEVRPNGSANAGDVGKPVPGPGSGTGADTTCEVGLGPAQIAFREYMRQEAAGHDADGG